MLSLLLPANEVRGKVMFLYLSVILFTGGCLPHCMLGYTPGRHSQADTPHWADTPWEDTPWQKALSWVDTSPPEYYRMPSISGRYTSYSNAYLFILCFQPMHNIITAHKWSLQRLCFYTCLSFCPQGGSTWVGTPHPPGRYTPRQVHPWAGTPPGQVHPPLGRYTHPWAGTPPRQVQPQGQVHPPG